MKKCFVLVISILILTDGYSQKSEIKSNLNEYKLDFTSPESVVNGFFYGLKSINLELLLLVTDQFIEEKDRLPGSRELIRLRDKIKKNDKGLIDDLNERSKETAWHIEGNSTISRLGDYAFVPVRVQRIKNGQIVINKSSMFTLIKRNGKWLLISIEDVVIK